MERQPVAIIALPLPDFVELASLYPGAAGVAHRVINATAFLTANRHNPLRSNPFYPISSVISELECGSSWPLEAGGCRLGISAYQAHQIFYQAVTLPRQWYP